MRAPFPPLVAGGEGLENAPALPAALRARMAALYGVTDAQILPVRGRLHGIELLMRLTAQSKNRSVAIDEIADVESFAGYYGLKTKAKKPGLRVVASPSFGTTVDDRAARTAAKQIAPGLLAVDESAVEFADNASLAKLAISLKNFIVIRSLELAYGLAGAPCAALIGNAAVIARLGAVMDLGALPTPIVRLAETALAPSRALATEARIAAVKAERQRMAQTVIDGVAIAETQGPWVIVTSRDQSLRAKLARFGVTVTPLSKSAFTLDVRDADSNDRALVALGAQVTATQRRRADVTRDTKETKITASVDFDTAGDVRIRTGIGFYDHMLEQVAAHGGFSARLACDGDLEIDPHHTIEDCALAFGAALKQALGERRGIARFGFLLPMDEAEARVSIDLGGRPFIVFDGKFTDARIGEYPTEMTEHIFRSLAESLGAAIHIEVRGANDHHKTEACFKAFGRALRQAIKIEGTAIPSTKGTL